MTLSRVYKVLRSVFILHGAVLIVSLTALILKVDFRKVVPANCDFSGFYWWFTQSWLRARGRFLSSLLYAKLDSFGLIFHITSFLWKQMLQCHHRDLSDQWPRGNSASESLYVRQTVLRGRQTTFLRVFVVRCNNDLWSWKFLSRTEAAKTSAGHRSGSGTHLL